MKMQTANLLVVDDDEYISLSAQILLEQHFSDVHCLANPNLIPKQLEASAYDAVLVDMNFQKGNTDGAEGLHWLSRIRDLSPETSVIMITAFAEVHIAVEALKMGAMDFITKPWQNEKLIATVHAAVKLSQSQRQLAQKESQQQFFRADLDQHFSDLIGRSEPMLKVIQAIEKVAQTDADVLILGENGTGKELVARAIHRASFRAKEAFINVDLGALSETLFESELFGHRKGAFTDARADRMGRFEAASGGTLFLDEIGNLSLPLQAKLLTALQNRKIYRLGSNQAIPVDIRLITATNQPLKKMIVENRFREDLLYRINTVEIHLPPLRERLEDIPLLVHHFLQTYALKYHKSSVNIPDYVVRKLQKYHWPGNVRELQHAVERAVIMGEGPVLRSSDFAFLLESEAEKEPLGPTIHLDSLEKWAIQQALRKHHGNVSKAADELGLTRGTLYRRMEKHEL
jgi:DNA-binding NtrC family response regulator